MISCLRAADPRESGKLGERDRLRHLRCLLISMNSKVLHALVLLFHTEFLMKIFLPIHQFSLGIKWPEIVWNRII